MKGSPKKKTEKKKELVETQILKEIFWQGIVITVHFWREGSFEQHNEFQVSLSL